MKADLQQSVTQVSKIDAYSHIDNLQKSTAIIQGFSRVDNLKENLMANGAGIQPLRGTERNFPPEAYFLFRTPEESTAKDEQCFPSTRLRAISIIRMAGALLSPRFAMRRSIPYRCASIQHQCSRAHAPLTLDDSATQSTSSG